MDFHTIDDEIYWDESVFYRFTADQIDKLEQVTDELNQMSLEAVDYVITNDLFSALKIPQEFAQYIKTSWDMDDYTVYGRFDLVYNGTGEPKLLEYNADTPTSLLESSVIQWFWMKDVFPDADQFNSIHEKLIDRWKAWPYVGKGIMHFACVRESIEDRGNTEYLRDTAIQAGFETRPLVIQDIGWDEDNGKFVDEDDNAIETLFKLYPWEWLVHDEFGPKLLQAHLRIIEPAWKMILSNKGILPVLWKMYPGHKNLVESYFEQGVLTDNYVRKPLLSREGESIQICRDGKITESEGSYGKEGFIYQKYCPLPCFDGNYPVVGSWVVGGIPAGIGIREDSSEVTTNGSRFVPHMFEEG